jgi:hypothetical protein
MKVKTVLGICSGVFLIGVICMGIYRNSGVIGTVLGTSIITGVAILVLRDVLRAIFRPAKKMKRTGLSPSNCMDRAAALAPAEWTQ